MEVIKNEHVVFFDIDGTLILPYEEGNAPTVDVFDAITKKFIRMRVHQPNVRLLIEEHHRGSYVIVWSRGGSEWAANVIKALHLEKRVHKVLTKPLVYFDDIAVEKWLPYRVFLDPDIKYKR